MVHNNCRCLKCGNEWFSAKLFFDRMFPKTCPKCHSYTWNEPRIRNKQR